MYNQFITTFGYKMVIMYKYTCATTFTHQHNTQRNKPNLHHTFNILRAITPNSYNMQYNILKVNWQNITYTNFVII